MNTLKHLYTVFVLSFTPLCPISLHINLNKLKGNLLLELIKIRHAITRLHMNEISWMAKSPMKEMK